MARVVSARMASHGAPSVVVFSTANAMYHPNPQPKNSIQELRAEFRCNCAVDLSSCDSAKSALNDAAQWEDGGSMGWTRSAVSTREASMPLRHNSDDPRCFVGGTSPLTSTTSLCTQYSPRSPGPWKPDQQLGAGSRYIRPFSQLPVFTIATNIRASFQLSNQHTRSLPATPPNSHARYQKPNKQAALSNSSSDPQQTPTTKMYFSTATILASLASLGAAAPSYAPSSYTPPQYFALRAFRTGTDVHNDAFAAAHSGLFAGLASQGASCDRDIPQNSATFTIIDGILYLYAQSATPQAFYVDRSATGEGMIGYTTGAQPEPAGSERVGWEIVDGYLSFGQEGLLACPSPAGGDWSIWAMVNLANPGGLTGCLNIAVVVEEVTEPVGCLYTE
ncbi:hypothetical protein B2J93_8789 [Marssonina coronariae]|uniref:Cell wall protein PhiA n=1 Tax=Diplocarpon coronariae TaxID=2795749 RepID=A0A218YVR3_9HELO|nr:hypothetical protein B2J93_8789 [Marssonina coronariae]